MKKTHIIGLVLIACCVGILISVLGSTSTYANFSESKLNPSKEYHVVGEWVKEKGFVYDPGKDPNLFQFPLKDEKGEVENVILKNNKPADFEKSEKIVVIGKMTEKGFEASGILMKCPSKYNDKTVKVKSSSL